MRRLFIGGSATIVLTAAVLARASLGSEGGQYVGDMGAVRVEPSIGQIVAAPPRTSEALLDAGIGVAQSRRAAVPVGDAFWADTLEQLVDWSEIILVGTVRSNVDVHEVLMTPSAPGGPAPPPPPVEVDLVTQSVTVEQAIKGSMGSEVTLSLPGPVPQTPQDWLDREAGDYPLGQVGQSFVIFAFGAPGSISPVNGPYGRVVNAGPTVTYFDGPRTAVPFAVGMTPAAFIQAVVDEVARQGG